MYCERQSDLELFMKEKHRGVKR